MYDDWDRLTEPGVELKEFDPPIHDAEIAMLDEIRMFEKYPLERSTYLDELTMDAWYLFVTRYRKSKRDSNLFIDSVCEVIPAISDRIVDKRNIARSMISDVASRLSKMIWADRKRKEARKEAKKAAQRAKPPVVKKTEREAKKERWEKLQREAADALLHGPKVQEFIFEGIRSKISRPPRYRSWSSGPKPKRHRKYTAWHPAEFSYSFEEEQLPYKNAADINDLVRRANEWFDRLKYEFPGPIDAIPRTMIFAFMSQVEKTDGFPKKNWRKEVGI